MDFPFIKTEDEETARKLMEEGLELIDHTGTIYTFLNLPDYYKGHSEYQKLHYSNVLTI